MNEQVTSRNYSSISFSGPHSPIETVLEAVHHLESSYGLHPFTQISLSDPAAIKKILAVLPGQQEWDAKDRLVILAVRPTITKDLINDYIGEISEAKKTSRESLYAYRKHIESTINLKDKEGRRWSEKQAFVALELMQSASKPAGVQLKLLAEHPLAEVDRLLDLGGKGLQAVMILQLHETPAHEKGGKNIQKELASN